ARRCGAGAGVRAALTRSRRPEHRRETARFWREHRVEAALREQCVVPAEEYERYARALERAVAMAADIREAERRQRETVRAALQVGEPCPALAANRAHSGGGGGRGSRGDASQDAEQPGPSGTHIGPDLDWMEPSQALTFIGHQVGVTGAKPPWLMEEEEEEEDGSKQIGPSYEDFLKQKEKQKLKKLPPERVGANFDHASQTGDGWLPSFGRVWNHGRRWQSRHQFRTESGEKKKKR
uniref:CCD84 protein n=1 Tax=Amazona collaria TaxID=241587 RepID=A0A8B9IXS6_9PSIT